MCVCAQTRFSWCGVCQLRTIFRFKDERRGKKAHFSAKDDLWVENGFMIDHGYWRRYALSSISLTICLIEWTQNKSGFLIMSYAVYNVCGAFSLSLSLCASAVVVIYLWPMKNGLRQIFLFTYNLGRLSGCQLCDGMTVANGSHAFGL